jgi:hypothetical protein
MNKNLLKSYIKYLIKESILSKFDHTIVSQILNLIKSNQRITSSRSIEEIQKHIENNISKFDKSTKQWLVKYLKENASNEAASFEEIFFGVLDDFNKFKQNLEYKDLFSKDQNGKPVYKTLADIRNQIEKFGDRKANISSDLGGMSYDKVFKNNKYRIYFPRDRSASCELGANTKWCVAATRSQNYFDNYTKTQNVFIYFVFSVLLNKNNPNYKIAFVLRGGNIIYHETVDSQDQILHREDLLKIYGNKDLELIEEKILEHCRILLKKYEGEHPNGYKYKLAIKLKKQYNESADKINFINSLDDEQKYMLFQELSDNDIIYILESNNSHAIETVLSHLLSSKYIGHDIFIYLCNNLDFKNKYHEKIAIRHLLSEEDYRQKYLASNPNITLNIQKILLKNFLFNAMTELIKNPKVDESILEDIVINYPNTIIAHEVVQFANFKLQKTIMRLGLAGHKIFLSLNPRLDPSIADLLLRDADDNVRSFALKNIPSE